VVPSIFNERAHARRAEVSPQLRSRQPPPATVTPRGRTAPLTRLASEVASRLADEFPDGVWFFVAANPPLCGARAAPTAELVVWVLKPGSV
jgi:hypothetical protein